MFGFFAADLGESNEDIMQGRAINEQFKLSDFGSGKFGQGQNSPLPQSRRFMVMMSSTRSLIARRWR